MKAPDEEVLAAFASLGLANDSTWAQVKVAYRDLVQVWHPDRFSHNPRLQRQAEKKLRDVNNSFEILKRHFSFQDIPNNPERITSNNHHFFIKINNSFIKSLVLCSFSFCPGNFCLHS